MTDSLVELRYLSIQIKNIIQYFILKYSDRRTDGYLSIQIKNIIQYFILKYSDRRTDGYLAEDYIHFLPSYIIISKKFLNCFLRRCFSHWWP